MDIRTHQSEHALSQATYSECGAYRYSLSRQWSDTGGLLNFVMLNPSKADERHNDPTVERCERRARMLGYGGLSVTNIFAWRDTDPHAMRRASEPNGPENDRILIETAQTATLIIAAWGTHGEHQSRGLLVANLLRSLNIPMHHLGLSKHGHPRHPLYVPYTQEPVLWDCGVKS